MDYLHRATATPGVRPERTPEPDPWGLTLMPLSSLRRLRDLVEDEIRRREAEQ